jgi:hypothetical protein
MLDRVELVVRSVDEDGAIDAIGLVLEPHEPPPARWTLARTLLDAARALRARVAGGRSAASTSAHDPKRSFTNTDL